MKTSKKILINASILGGQLNGVSVYTIEILKQLVDIFNHEGADFVIYSYRTPHLDFIPSGKIQQIKLPKFLEAILGKKRSLHRIVWNLIILKKLAKNYDVVYSPSSHGFIGANNQIITIHDLICLSYPDQNKMQYWYFRYLVPFIVKKTKVIAISNFTHQEILDKLGVNKEQVSTIYNGADHLYGREINFRHDSANQLGFDLLPGEFFLTVGANYTHKNIMMLLEVASTLSHSGYKFVIVGCNGPYRKVVEDRIKDKALKNVILMPYVTNSDLSNLYKYCKANIYISLHEGFGFPPIEAAVFDKISIVSNSSCMPEIFGNNVIYVDPNNLTQIVEKVSLFSENKIDEGKFKAGLMVLRTKYKWRKTAEDVFNVIVNTKRS